MHRFFSEDLTLSSTEIILNEVESQHACKVLRLPIGSVIELFNGLGIVADAKIAVAHYKNCQVDVLSVNERREPEGKIHIAICPTKSNDRFEWFIEKAVEIGVDEITPLISENSERTKLNMERLEKVILSAVKQSLRFYKPKLNEPLKVKQFIKQYPSAMIAHCDPKFDRSELQLYEKNTKLTVMIGPEGDFSTSEIQCAIQHNLKSVSLGNNRLRTETAGLVAVTLLNATRI